MAGGLDVDERVLAEPEVELTSTLEGPLAQCAAQLGDEGRQRHTRRGGEAVRPQHLAQLVLRRAAVRTRGKVREEQAPLATWQTILDTLAVDASDELPAQLNACGWTLLDHGAFSSAKVLTTAGLDNDEQAPEP